jgi:transcriptional regulator with XRE-family HTH domain
MRVEQYIKENGLTLEKFGEMVGVKHMTVGRWIKGDCFPSSKVMKIISKKTNGVVSPNDFYSDQTQ